jgi:hypothetical protein
MCDSRPARTVGTMNGRFRLRVVFVASIAIFVVCAGNAGAGWTAPRVLEPRCAKNAINCPIETSPRVAVNARGQSVVAWIDATGRVRVATGDRRGRFSRPVVFEKAFRPAVSISAGGTVLVVWSRRSRLRFVRRSPGHRFTRPAQLVAPVSRLSDDSPKAAIQPDGATLVVYEATVRTPTLGYQTQLRSVRIAPSGRPGRSISVGAGSASRDGFGASSAGQVAVCCLTEPAAPMTAIRPMKVATYARGAGWTTLAPPLGPRQVVESVSPGLGDVSLGTVDVRHSGDGGTSGAPGLLRADARGVFAAPLAAPVTNPGRAFAPVVVIDGAGRSVLVYQEKDDPTPFSRNAPLYAVTGTRTGAFGARQVLDRRLVRYAAMRSYRSGAIVAWEAPRNRWGIALERGGRFAPAPVPAGPGPSGMGEDFVRNRDLTTAGRYAALAWTAADATVRVSIGAL